MINTLSKINLSKIGWEGEGSTSIWINSLNILFFRTILLSVILSPPPPCFIVFRNIMSHRVKIMLFDNQTLLTFDVRQI